MTKQPGALQIDLLKSSCLQFIWLRAPVVTRFEHNRHKMQLCKRVRHRVLPYWKTWVIILMPCLLLWLPIAYPCKESNAAYAILLISTLWMTEALPLPITSLLPVLLFPLLGVMDTETTTTTYMKESSIMVIGEVFLAEAVEHCHLHTRIAYGFLMLFGPSPRWFLLGTMLATAFLCMFICNNAVMVVMVPVVEDVVNQLYEADSSDGHGDRSSPDWSLDTVSVSIAPDTASSGSNSSQGVYVIPLNEDPDMNDNQPKVDEEKHFKRQGRQLRNCILLAVAYSAHLGSTGTMIGASPNLALKGILSVFYGTSRGVNFATWMAFTIPFLLASLLLTWLWLQLYFFGFQRIRHRGTKEEAQKILRNNYEALGRFSIREIITLTLFLLLIVLWALRDQEFLHGWGELIENAEVGDCTALMIITIALFVIPAEPQFCCRSTKGVEHSRRSETILNWKHVRSIIPWATVFLLGGGFATAYSWVKSGLWNWLMNAMGDLSQVHPVWIIIIACFLASTLAEIVNPTVAANIILPVLAVVADNIRLNPLALLLPGTIATSLTFILPVAKRPLSDVFQNIKMRRFQMIKVGVVVNILSVLTLCTLMASFGAYVYSIKDFPAWAHPYPKPAGETDHC